MPEALIVGGGIGGVTAARCLARTGARVRLFEQASDFGEIGAGIQLSPNCTRVLHHLGLAGALDRVAFLPEGTEMRQWRTGAVLSSNVLGAHTRERYGFPYYHVHRADLMRVLSDAARAEPNIELNTRSRATGFAERDGRIVLNVNGDAIAGDVLIGADGIHSTVRAALFGAEHPTFTGCVAWRALVPVERLPKDLVRPVSSVWWGPHKHFVHYYVRAGELVNCVCVVEKRGWETEAWNVRGEHAELAADFRGWHPTITTLIDNVDRDACFKWALFDRPPMASWSRGRATLLGDACHPTLPFMAQGAAMAIEDGAVLASCLEGSGDVATSLVKYETLRRARTARIQTGSRRNAKVFHLSGVRAWLRNRALRAAPGSALPFDELFRYDPLAAGKPS